MRQLALLRLSTGLLAALGASLASAEEGPTGALPQNTGSGAAEAIAGAGAFVAWTEHARTDTHRGTLAVHAGYAAGLGWASSGAAEVVLLAPRTGDEAPRTGRNVGIALRGGGFSRGGDDSVHGELGLKAQLAFEHDAGLDLAAVLSYQNEGFNLRPAVVPMLVVGTHLGSVVVLANLLYGHGLADDERFGAARLALLQPLTEQLHVGVDSKVELDLELDDDEPEGEPQIILQAGPAATWALGNVAVSAQGGVSLVQLRFEEPNTGGVLLLGAGGAF